MAIQEKAEIRTWFALVTTLQLAHELIVET